MNRCYFQSYDLLPFFSQIRNNLSDTTKNNLHILCNSLTSLNSIDFYLSI